MRTPTWLKSLCAGAWIAAGLALTSGPLEAQDVPVIKKLPPTCGQADEMIAALSADKWRPISGSIMTESSQGPVPYGANMIVIWVKEEGAQTMVTVEDAATRTICFVFSGKDTTVF